MASTLLAAHDRFHETDLGLRAAFGEDASTELWRSAKLGRVSRLRVSGCCSNSARYSASLTVGENVTRCQSCCSATDKSVDEIEEIVVSKT